MNLPAQFGEEGSVLKLHSSNSKAPIDLGVQMLFQDKRVRFLFFSCGKPHQNILNITSRSRQKDLGKRNKNILYAGISFAAVLIKVVLPAWERNLDFQPEMREDILDLRSSKAIDFL